MTNRSIWLAALVLMVGCGVTPLAKDVKLSYRAFGEEEPSPIPSVPPSQDARLAGFWEIRPSCRTFSLHLNGDGWTVSVGALSKAETDRTGTFDGHSLALHLYDPVLDRSTDLEGTVNKNGTISGRMTVSRTLTVVQKGGASPAKKVLSTSTFYAYRDGTVVLP